MSTTSQYSLAYLEEDHGPRALAACTIILVIATILFPLRFYARSLAPGQRSWDDHLLIPAYLLLLGLIASVYCEVLQAGLGRHAAAVMMEDPNMITTYLKLLYILDWFYVPSNMLSRVSVVSMYLRIFTDRWARAACWAVIVFLVANCLATIIAAQLECTPIAFIWDKSVEGGKCFNQMLWYQVTNIPNIVGDVMIAILPVKTIWTIKASTARKAGIAGVCLMGSIGLIASCVRTSIFFMQADVISSDPTFCDEAFSWTVIECGMYFAAACLIGMRPLFVKFPSFLKIQFAHTAGNTGQRSAFGQRTTDRLRLKSDGNDSHYVTMQDAGDMETGLYQRSGEYEAPIPLPGYQIRSPVASEGNLASEIRVETNIEVRRDMGDWSYGKNVGGYGNEYVYNMPVNAK